MPAETVETLRARLERLRVAALAVAWNITDRWTCDAKMLAKMDALRAALDETKPEPASGEGMGEQMGSLPSQGAASTRERLEHYTSLLGRASVLMRTDGVCNGCSAEPGEGFAHETGCEVERILSALVKWCEPAAAQHDTRTDRDGGQARSAHPAPVEGGDVVRLSDEWLRAKLRDATPGPWRAQADDDTCWSDGTVDVLKDIPGDDEDGGYRLASVGPAFPDESVARRADVHLIAAAPDLAADVLRLRAMVRKLADGIRGATEGSTGFGTLVDMAAEAQQLASPQSGQDAPSASRERAEVVAEIVRMIFDEADKRRRNGLYSEANAVETMAYVIRQRWGGEQ